MCGPNPVGTVEGMTEKNSSPQDFSSWGAGLAIGVGVGVALGTGMHNIGAGMAIGIALGAAFAIAFTEAAKKRRRDQPPE